MIKKSFILITVVITALFLYSCGDNNPNNPVIDSSNITLISTYDTYASVNSVYIYPVNFRNIAYIADGSSGLQLVDVTQVNYPDSVSSYNTQGYANDVFTAGINNSVYAFVSDYNGGFAIIDVSNTSNPLIVGIITYPEGTYVNTSFIDALNKIAYVGLSTGQLMIYDISQLPSAPSHLSTYITGNTINGIYASGGTLYAVTGATGLQILNVSNPSSPVLYSSENTSGIASGIKVSTGIAFVADSYNGLLIYNVTNPSTPSFLARYPAYEQVLGVALNNNSLYTADNGYGVESVNVSGPSSPQQSGYIKLNSSASTIFYFGGYLFLAAAEGGMAILQPVN